jgi:hypothetical protein
MADRPDESLSALTRRLSALLGTEDGAQTLAVMQRLELLARRGEDGRPEPSSDPGSLRLGIWEPEAQPDGRVEFVRSGKYVDQWHFWADVERLPAKRGPRVVLLGESVARGYLYDPLVTPARVLEMMLRSVDGLEDADVVDLARTDHVPDAIQTMFDPLPAVEPDAVVLFAGNAWQNVGLDLAHLQELADALRAGGYAELRRVMLEQVLLPRWRLLLDGLADSVAPFEIPVVLIVPEFNLHDWKCEPEVLAPVLPGDDNVGWMAAREAAAGALRERRFADAERHAWTMLALDHGTSSAAYDLLAEALLALGRTEEARAALEGSRDALYGLYIAHSPRCHRAVQDVLRAKADEHGFGLVDLPRLLEERGILPDRRILIDYCHLTIAGMRIAMAAAAEPLISALAAHGARASELEQVAIPVRPEDEALAHLLAAIHNAHWGQGRDVVGYHARRAVELAPQSTDLLRAYVDAQSRGAEPWLTEAFDRLTRAPNARRYMTTADPRHLGKLADFDLVDAVADALEAVGVPAREEVAKILRSEHGRAPRVDLLDPRYRATTFRGRDGYSLGPQRAYHRALDLVSRFFLIRDDSEPLLLRVTARLPAGEGDVHARVNGSTVATFAAGREWRNAEISVPADAVRPGLNRVDLRWPLLAPPSAKLLEKDARRLERGLYPEVLPAYGEVHAFTAEPAGELASNVAATE